MMKKIWKLTEKDFKLIWRSKSSIGVILISPLILTLLLGMAFHNTELYTISVGVHAQQYREQTQALIAKLTENFEVNKLHTKETCIETVKTNQNQICIIFPDDLQLKTNQAQTIQFYVDNSRVNLVWMILDTLSSRLSTSSSEIRYELITDVLDSLFITKKELLPFEKELSLLMQHNNQTRNQTSMNNAALQSLDIEVILGNTNTLFLRNKEMDSALIALAIAQEVGAIKDSIEALTSEINSVDSIPGDKKDELTSSLTEMRKALSAFEKDVLKAKNNIQDLLDEFDSLILNTTDQLYRIKDRVESNIQNNEHITLLLHQDLALLKGLFSRSQSIQERVNQIKVTNASTLVNPIITEIRPLAAHQSPLGFIFPTLLILIIVFTSLFLSSALVFYEHKSRAAFRNSITPTPKYLFICSTYLISLVIVAAQGGFFVLVSFVLFKTPVSFGWLSVLFFFLTSTVFILLGILIGLLFRSEQGSLLGSLSMASIFLFFSNTILPVESLSPVMKKMVAFNPFVISEQAFRKIMIHGLHRGLLMNELYLILIYIFLLILLIFLLAKVRR